MSEMPARPSWSLALLPFLLLLALPASTKAKKLPTHLFLVGHADFKEEAVKSATKEDIEALQQLLITRVKAKIDAEKRLISEWPKDTPDFDAEAKHRNTNKRLRAFLRRRRLEAHKIRLHVTKLERTDVAEEATGHHTIGMEVSLQIFGESLPDRVMSFTGEGSAKVMVQVGKKVRDKDRSYAENEAFDQAIEQALQEALRKLDAPKKNRKKK